jgi:hypothetical protein
MTDLTPRQRIVLAVLAAEPGAEFGPIQVQNLFFLVDENVAEAICGRQFVFEPDGYGPFDAAVYRELEALETAGLVRIDRSDRAAGRQSYTLTVRGYLVGDETLGRLPASIRAYMAELVSWVRDQPFAQMVGAINRMYPEMGKIDIFTV